MMMSDGASQSPLISCIVPVFNGERYLRETLDSILGQTYPATDVIVVDDGSIDDSPAVVASYGDRVRYVWQSHAGAPSARNLGLGTARGDLVAFLDADDLWHPEKLARQAARFQLRPALDLCITHVRCFREQDSPEETEVQGWWSSEAAAPGYYVSALLARREVFIRIGPFDTDLRYRDQSDWFLRATEQGAATELLPDVLVYRRVHQSNLSRVTPARNRAEYVQIVKALLDRRRHAAEGPIATASL